MALAMEKARRPAVVAGMLPYVVLTATAFLWAGNWVAGRGLQDVAAPGAIGLWRWSVAALALAPLALPAMWRERAVIRAELPRLATIAVLGVTLASNSIYWGLRTTSAINGGLYGAMTPIFVILIAWVLFGQRATWRQALGIAVSALGVVMVISRGRLDLLLGLHFGWGDGVLLGGIFLWSAYMVLVRAWPSRLSPAVFLGSIIAIGLPCFVPLYLVDRAILGPTPFSQPLLYGALYLGIGTSVIGYLAWNWGLAKLGAARTSQFMYLIPLFAAMQAIVLLGETLETYHVASAMLIIAGIAVATRDRALPGRGDRPAG